MRMLSASDPLTGLPERLTNPSDGEWLARFEPDRAVVTHEHAKGDAAARGTASDLLLLMWGRVPVEQLEVFGDASLFASWHDGMR